MANANVSIPMKLDAFVFNQDVCDGGEFDAKIAPITQPNYTFLRTTDYLLQNDLLDPVDLANATPHDRNMRLTDLGTGKIREKRLGVYLHWILPRLYRSGSAATPSAASRGSSTATALDPTAPQFRPVPTRWLVIRKLDASTIKPVSAVGLVDLVEGWVVESDRVREIDKLAEGVDLQVDVSPYILSSSHKAVTTDPKLLGKQAEIFIGYKESAETWAESGSAQDRIDLNLLNSSNQLFPDYQPHNSNVFSVLDTFKYRDKDGSCKALTDAVASYYVLGWHDNTSDDPFTLKGEKRTKRLSDLNAILHDMADLDSWLNDTTDTHSICHGAMYEVEWHSRWKNGDDTSNTPRNLPANSFTEKLKCKMPIAVGTTPMDSVLAYIHANHEEELENDIFRIETLLRAQSDSVTGQQAGEDEVQNYNFATSGGGAFYVLPVEKDRPAQTPSDEDQLHLKLANQAQALVNAGERALQKTQKGLFSLWWKYQTDRDRAQAVDSYQTDARNLTSEYESLNKMLATQRTAVSTEIGKLSITPKTATLNEFTLAKDPSLLVAGAASGWPEDFLKALMCRLDYQIDTFGQPLDPEFKKKYFIGCIPSDLQPTALALVQEFLDNTPSRFEDQTTRRESVTGDEYKTYRPLYHDHGDPDVQHLLGAPWRDRWTSTQPWFPLFLEWQAEFHHIEFDKWQLEQTTSRIESQTKFRHGIKPDKTPLWEDTDVGDDICTLSGRILILPQPTFSLQAQIDQLFSSTNPDLLDKYLCLEDRNALQAGVSSLALLSAPLSGFVNQLSTTLQGNHLKPNIRFPGQSPEPIAAAWAESSAVGLEEKQLGYIGIQSDVTPYGSLVGVPPNGYSAFKPATHGQFCFTRLNIVDKFGQCAPAIERETDTGIIPSIYPCLSDYVAPQNFGEYANVARKPAKTSVCEFAQIPPQINQPTRLNAVFVKPDEDASKAAGPAYWRPVRAWDSPIWGWIVVNYVDNGIQFFLQDGTFYREARGASPDNPRPVSKSQRWKPFGRGASTPNTYQIDRLIDQFTEDEAGQKFLDHFISMCTDSVNQSHPAPSSYGRFVNALVGKPLALVNVGCTLEMASDAQANQSTAKGQPDAQTKYHLLPQSDDDPNQYQFALKLGDHNRLYDGLVGYFKAFENPWKQDPPLGNELDLSTLYTTYGDIKEDSRVKSIDESTFPKLKAFYTDPRQYVDLNDPAPQFQAAYNANLNRSVYGCIVDPFLPLHTYMGGGIAPVQPLQLPDWTWKSALDKMTAFFHFGPLVVTDDVPGYKSDYDLPSDYASKWEQLTVPNFTLPLPSLKVADWRWLQGYPPGKPAPEPPETSEVVAQQDDQEEKFMALALGKLDATPRFQPGPYTAVEGYLQMKAPIEINGGRKAE
ncbi:uncharacterized protein JN550_006162 [Neoarthrinium moseri]|uniref:uncharacterized protein n=1 Tax=Neoarthrinium moseri TaxID=1658444 RepID=UPI001FDB290C|nr:uncharacterized protein JN550_006162 [Neoarthrinium moseri]KAI1868587.1 hypothetical protein JN550_006162 [Neoarthrinium moseri]